MLLPLACVAALAGDRDPEPQLRVDPDGAVVRIAPSPTASLRGLTMPGASFRVLGTASGTGCAAGWVQVEAQGYVCLDGTEPTDVEPEPQPVLLDYDPPDPAEYAGYVATGEYHDRHEERLVPGIYARRYKRFEGRLYASAAAYAAGDEPVGQLSREIGAKERFLRIQETDRGPVLVRGDGQVAALADVYLYPVSRLRGFDLEGDPLKKGRWPAYAIAYNGTPIYASPDDKAPVVGTVPYHTPLEISSTPADPEGRWWEVVAGDVKGFTDDQGGLRHPVPSPERPEGVDDDELWVDVELGQQVLMVFRGDTLVYFTLVSTGVSTKATPKGTYHLLQKDALKDMKSRPDADDWYQVEDVPWAMTFRRYYMLHTAYWHWGFGRPASHGCVNLAPRDAAWLFARLPPFLPDGWTTIYARSTDDPATVRVRRGDQLRDEP